MFDSLHLNVLGLHRVRIFSVHDEKDKGEQEYLCFMCFIYKIDNNHIHKTMMAWTCLDTCLLSKPHIDGIVCGQRLIKCQ